MKKYSSFSNYVINILSHQFKIQVGPERMASVRKDIRDNSMPEVRFYVMVLVSTLIASFGLVSDSTAVVIGAMLVAPLMTPIFGISMAMVRGDSHLLKGALQAELLGVLMAITMGILVGLLVIGMEPSYEATHEMLSRTRPNLFDLVVAVLAGFAGAYALIDEKISPALPGVAIATAIVPPLANCGLCIGYGAYNGAMGSFLLFFANFLSILLVSSLLFYHAGIDKDLTKMDYFRRFGLAAVCFIFIATFLGYSLLQLLQENQLRSTVRTILAKEFANFSTSGLEDMLINSHGGTLYVLAQVYASNHFDPNQVQSMEQHLSQELERPAKLIIREIRSTDVSASGSNSIVIANNLDGFFVSNDSSPDVRTIRESSQAIREFLSDNLRFNLVDVDLLHLKGGPVIVAMITGYRQFSLAEIQELENKIRQATSNPEIRLMIRNVEVSVLTSTGPLRYGWTTLHVLTEQEKTVRKRILDQIKSEFSKNDNYMVANVNTVFKEDSVTLLVEIEGSGAYTREDLQLLQKQLQKQSDRIVTLYVWLNHGAVMTANGLRGYESLSETRIQEFEEKGKEWLNILRSSNN